MLPAHASCGHCSAARVGEPLLETSCMIGFLIRRAGAGLLTLLLLSLIAFVGAEILPGNPARAILGNDASEEAVAVLTKQLCLDRPAPVRNFDCTGNALTGDLGVSYAQKAPVGEMLAAAGSRSATLAGVTLCLIVPLSMFAGLWSARHAGGIFDRIATYG